MYISEIELFRFRNLEQQRLQFAPGLTVIVGKNGHGKTSLLEAIYLLSQPRSFRGARPRELPRWSGLPAESAGIEPPGGYCRVAANVETAAGPVAVGYEIQDGDRSVFVNGKPVTRLGSFLGQVTSVEFTPDELSLLKGPPANRRQFLDRTLAMIKPGYIEQLVSYNRAVKNRNKVLTTLLSKGGAAIEKLLGPWDEAMIAYGRTVVEARMELTAALADPFKQAHHGLTAADSERTENNCTAEEESVALVYRSTFIKGMEIKSPDEIRQQLLESRERDLRYRSTSFGAHHDDLIVYLRNPQDSEKEFGREVAHGGASQGQIRSAALSLKVASARLISNRTGDEPILLLDDVESELDEQRRHNLYGLILELGHQVFVTTTDLSRTFAGRFPEAKILSMDKGRIS